MEIEQQKLMEEKNEIKKEIDAKLANFEEREECLNTILENGKIIILYYRIFSS